MDGKLFELRWVEHDRLWSYVPIERGGDRREGRGESLCFNGGGQCFQPVCYCQPELKRLVGQCDGDSHGASGRHVDRPICPIHITVDRLWDRYGDWDCQRPSS